MIDVNKITSTLAKLPDQQLQQYAQMHKSDPYIMALAMSESNRRKEMRAAGQGAQGMQEQPKVVDQMVAEMAPQQLPEEMGIGQLPAGSMNFAGGGIVAFADGGDVERYQTGGMPYDPYAYGYNPLSAEQQSALKARATPPQITSMTRDLVAQAKFKQINGLPLLPEEKTALERAASSATPAQKITPTYSPDDLSGMDRRLMSGSQPSIPSITPPAPPRKSITAAPAPAPAPTPAAVAATDPSTQPEVGGLDALMQNYTRQQDLARGAARNAAVGYASKLREEGAKLVSDEEKRVAEKPDVYKDREARLLKQEKGLEGMGDKYLGLALLQAGAAMMTTPGGIGMALGKGVQVGSERYVAGIDKINAAKEKFALAKDRIEDLRLSRADMNERDIRDAKKEARLLERQAEALFYTGAKDDLNMTDKQLTTLLGLAADSLGTDKKLAADAARTDKQIKSAEGIARLQASTANRTPEGIQTVERIMKEKNIPFSEAYAFVQGTKREPMSVEKLRADWLDTAKRVQIAQDYPNVKTFEDYLTVMNAGGAGGAGGFKVVGVR